MRALPWAVCQGNFVVYLPAARPDAAGRLLPTALPAALRGLQASVFSHAGL